MLQARSQVVPLFDVPPSAFHPPPKVESAVVRLVPKPIDQVGIADPERFSHVVKAAFGQRRKTLRNALHGVVTAERMQAAGIDPKARAEQLAPAAFVALAGTLDAEG